MMPEIQIIPTQDELTAAAAALFLKIGRQAIQDRGRFSVALSGGSTPLPLYRRLAEPGLDSELDWSKIHFFWGDERAVGKEHPDSNFGQAYRALLAPRQIPPRQIHRVRGESQPADAARSYQQEILDFFPETPPRLDLVLLGMGSDGHTASLFPGTSVVRETGRPEESWVDAVHAPRLDSWRITFTPRLINAARRILFLVSGADKAETLYQVLKGPYQPRIFPSQLIGGKVTWLVDQEAGSLLKDL